MYVRSAKAFMLDSPKYKAERIFKLIKGTSVEELIRKGTWVKIKLKGKEGWLPKMVLSKKPPKKRISLLSQKVDIASKARKRASRYSSTAAVRALTSGRQRLNTVDAPDFEALRDIERLEINEQEAIDFLLQ
jgi:hypothetical protein